jgi:hypothetical protein
MTKIATMKLHGFTAAQVAKGELEPLGKQIAAHLQKMRGYEVKAHEKAGVELRRADNHWDTITQLLAEAKAKCDGGGFNAFKEKYCPNLSRSRIYELLAIGSRKKTLKESRAEKRERVAKSRGKVSATSSVADKPQSGPVKKTLLESGEVITSPSPTDEDPAASAEKRKFENAALDEISAKTSAPRSGAAIVHHKSMNAADIALNEFNSHLLRLLQMTEKAKAARFAKTAVPAEKLNKLAVFLSDIANVKSPAPTAGEAAPIETVH